jgi:uncharacterized protein with HEPN domain
MPRDGLVYLQDILEAIIRIREYTGGMDRRTFEKDGRTVDAVLHNLAIIGEAAKKVPRSLRDRSAGVEWRKIAGMRDLIAHAYFQVDLDIVWDVVFHKLDPLEQGIRRLVQG